MNKRQRKRLDTKKLLLDTLQLSFNNLSKKTAIVSKELSKMGIETKVLTETLRTIIEHIVEEEDENGVNRIHTERSSENIKNNSSDSI